MLFHTRGTRGKYMHPIVADENIPCVREAFSHLGDVRLLPGRAMSRELLADAELLLVRAVAKVDAKLLHDTAVRFVATATIGTDHVDTNYLTQQGIAFTSAAGSNANSVAEYVMAALLHHAVKHELALAKLTLGIVGVGHIGSRVAKMAAGLGMRVLLNDPPLARQTHDPKFLPLDALMEADVITLHTPLTHTGEDATVHLFDRARLQKMKPGSILFNTCRGEVVDNAALKEVLQSGHLRSAVLDVWEDEPEIDMELLQLVEIGTPHIAGYSLDGKLNGTNQIYRAACEFLGIAPQWQMEKALPVIAEPAIRLEEKFGTNERKLDTLIKRVYDIASDDRRLRAALNMPAAEGGRHFDELRKKYPVRREFHNYAVNCETEEKNLISQISALGFRVEE
jgi:erythronate-4-phosphate dehydrogenase